MKAVAFLLILTVFAATAAACSQSEDRPVTLSASSHSATITQSRKTCVNLNTATVEELTQLPGVGEITARKMVEHRTDYGPFCRTEDIIIVDGFSEKKYRKLAGLICVE